MPLLRIFERFPSQLECITYLERIRFGDKPFCPHCGGFKVARKAENNRVNRWNCKSYGFSFNVLSGTIFQKTKIPLQKWFLAISLVMDAKKSLSSHQLARHLNLRQGAAWYLLQRIRSEMASKNDSVLLQRIVEADETYLGRKPWTNSHWKVTSDAPHGRGTPKLAVLGVVQRRGQVFAQVAEDCRIFDSLIRGFSVHNIGVSSNSELDDSFVPYSRFRFLDLD